MSTIHLNPEEILLGPRNPRFHLSWTGAVRIVKTHIAQERDRLLFEGILHEKEGEERVWKYGWLEREQMIEFLIHYFEPYVKIGNGGIRTIQIEGPDDWQIKGAIILRKLLRKQQVAELAELVTQGNEEILIEAHLVPDPNENWYVDSIVTLVLPGVYSASNQESNSEENPPTNENTATQPVAPAVVDTNADPPILPSGAYLVDEVTPPVSSTDDEGEQYSGDLTESDSVPLSEDERHGQSAETGQEGDAVNNAQEFNQATLQNVANEASGPAEIGRSVNMELVANDVQRFTQTAIQTVVYNSSSVDNSEMDPEGSEGQTVDAGGASASHEERSHESNEEEEEKEEEEKEEEEEEEEEENDEDQNEEDWNAEGGSDEDWGEEYWKDEEVDNEEGSNDDRNNLEWNDEDANDVDENENESVNENDHENDHENGNGNENGNGFQHHGITEDSVSIDSEDIVPLRRHITDPYDSNDEATECNLFELLFDEENDLDDSMDEYSEIWQLWSHMWLKLSRQLCGFEVYIFNEILHWMKRGGQDCVEPSAEKIRTDKMLETLWWLQDNVTKICLQLPEDHALPNHERNRHRMQKLTRQLTRRVGEVNAAVEEVRRAARLNTENARKRAMNILSRIHNINIRRLFMMNKAGFSVPFPPTPETSFFADDADLHSEIDENSLHRENENEEGCKGEKKTNGKSVITRWREVRKTKSEGGWSSDEEEDTQKEWEERFAPWKPTPQVPAWCCKGNRCLMTCWIAVIEKFGYLNERKSEISENNQHLLL